MSGAEDIDVAAVAMDVAAVVAGVVVAVPGVVVGVGDSRVTANVLDSTCFLVGVTSHTSKVNVMWSLLLSEGVLMILAAISMQFTPSGETNVQIVMRKPPAISVS